MNKGAYFSHESAVIEKGSVIGRETKIWHFSHIMGTAVIGERCSIGQNCFIAGKIGSGCKLQNNVNIYEGVELGDWVFCGPSMTFTNDMNPRAKYPKGGHYIATMVEEGVSLGANCTIICGITIGKWAFVGAGSVVTRDVPDYALVFGNPAGFKGWICECGVRMPDNPDGIKCKNCSSCYIKNGSRLIKV